MNRNLTIVFGYVTPAWKKLGVLIAGSKRVVAYVAKQLRTECLYLIGKEERLLDKILNKYNQFNLISSFNKI